MIGALYKGADQVYYRYISHYEGEIVDITEIDTDRLIHEGGKIEFNVPGLGVIEGDFYTMQSPLIAIFVENCDLPTWAQGFHIVAPFDIEKITYCDAS